MYIHQASHPARPLCQACSAAMFLVQCVHLSQAESQAGDLSSLLWSSFWSRFSAWLCRSFAGVSSVGVHCLQHSGLNRQGRCCEFQSEHFHAGSVYFAPACIGCHINCCCCFLLLLLATCVHNLMHTWRAVVCVYAQGFSSCSSHSNRLVYSAPSSPDRKSVV